MTPTHKDFTLSELIAVAKDYFNEVEPRPALVPATSTRSKR
jgi:hypothetical protein